MTQQKPNRLFRAVGKLALFGTTDEAVIRAGCKKLKRVQSMHEKNRQILQARADQINREGVYFQQSPCGWTKKNGGKSAQERYLDLIFPGR